MWAMGGDDIASGVGRALLYFVPLLAGALIAAWVVDVVKGLPRRGEKATRALLGTGEPPPWMTGDWACARCRTVNRAARDRCQGCRSRRADVQMLFEPPPLEPDAIPTQISVGPGGVARLEHNADAHGDRLNGHWRLRVNGVVTGTAATRDGALTLLRAVDGTRGILFDPHGTGTTLYRLDALIAEFEGSRLPFEGVCPEHGGPAATELVRNPPSPHQPRNVTPR